MDTDGIAVCCGWRSALNPRSLDEFTSNNIIAKFAERELTVHWILIEPGSRDIDDSSTGRQTIIWLQLGYDWIPVEHELKIRGVVVCAFNEACYFLSVRCADFFVISDADVHILADEYGNDSTLTSNIR